MIRLSLPVGPYWIDLPDGVRLKVRPLDTALQTAARYRGSRVVADIVNLGEGLADLGIDIDVADIMGDQDRADGLSQMIYVQALAVMAITDWEGVGDDDGKPVAVTDKNVMALMRIHHVAEAFLVAYTAAHAQLVSEGNGSAAASNGISATAADTANNAASTARPAPTESPAPAGSDARTSNMSRKPSRAGKPGKSRSA